MSGEPAAVRVEDLSKVFRAADGTEVRAVDGVSFECKGGEIVGLLGPNGAGKTTTLRILATILKPSAGRVSVAGHDVVTSPDGVRRSLGYVSAATGVYERLSAAETLEYYGRLHGMDEATIARRAEELVGALDMADFADRRTEGFSQGQRTKTAIARALVHQPRNVILDEPTHGLDVMTTRAMRGFLRRLREEGRCVLFSSHIMQEVAALCDRIVVIAKGRVVAQGSADELRAQTGEANLEDAFVKVIGTDEGLFA